MYPLTAYFIIVQVFFGFDTGFFTELRKRNKIIANCVSYFSTACMFCAIISCIIIRPSGILPYFLLACYSCCIISFKVGYSKNNIKNFYDDLLAIDKKWNTGVSDFNFGVLIGFYALIMIVSKSIVLVMYSVLFGYDNVFTTYGVHVIWLLHSALDMLAIINAIIFYVTFKRFKALKVGLRSLNYAVKIGLDFFDEIADCLEKVRTEHDKLVSAQKFKLQLAIHSNLTAIQA